MNEKYAFWTQNEDDILRELREQRQITKWSLIAQIMQRQFNLKGRSGKKCRERYENHLNSSMKRQQWTFQQEKTLIELHNQIGNKWVEIARQLQRTDNSVKNHYHSKLRKAFRKINKCISEHFRRDLKPFKINLLSKIIQAGQQCYSQDIQTISDKAKKGLYLKNKILQKANRGEGQILTPLQIQEMQNLVLQIYDFNKQYLKCQSTSSITKTSQNRYKGKEIINLLQENSKQPQLQKANRLCAETALSIAQYSDESQKNSSKAQYSNLNSKEDNSSQIQQKNRDLIMFNACKQLNLFSYWQAYTLPFIQQHESVSIFSGKTSSFTCYKPINISKDDNEATTNEFSPKLNITQVYGYPSM